MFPFYWTYPARQRTDSQARKEPAVFACTFKNKAETAQSGTAFKPKLDTHVVSEDYPSTSFALKEHDNSNAGLFLERETAMQSSEAIEPGDHDAFMNYALHIALASPTDATNTHRIASILTNATTGQILSTGYSHELPGDLSPSDMGSTHAEQVCFMKIAQKHDLPISQAEFHIGSVLPEEGCVLYTTMEPCSRRSKEGWRSCCERILVLREKVKCVVVGMGHAGIEGNEAERVLGEGGVEFVRMEEEMGRRCEEVAKRRD